MYASAYWGHRVVPSDENKRAVGGRLTFRSSCWVASKPARIHIDINGGSARALSRSMGRHSTSILGERIVEGINEIVINLATGSDVLLLCGHTDGR